MSVVICERCDSWIDSDYDPDCFVEIGNMRRLPKTIILCEPCRERADRDSGPEYEHEDKLREK